MNGVHIHAAVGPAKHGASALLLLHGYPQSHAIWHKVAPRLAEKFNVVAADLRGYGDSSKSAADHSKRAMAKDQVELMRALGHERFFLCGHDRGGRVSHRLAIDHPERVLKVAVLDIAPTLAMYEQTSEPFARAYWHWFFLIRTAPQPERMIGADPLAFLHETLGAGRPAGMAPFTPEALAEYERCFTSEAIHSMCEDYRASAGVDLILDRADRDAGRKVAAPLLALWGNDGIIGKLFQPLEEWRRVAASVRGHGVPGGHYVPEEAPEELAAALEEFFQEAV
ncbi:MAG TPA: alpha/beta hydrolase [Myxococcales bacterium]|nr:alpha/beta hydrolase [Myxococcales bacterium]